MALGHLIVLVPHDGRAVDIGGNFPAEGFIKQIVLGGRGQIFAAPDHMGDSHEMIVHHIGKIIGGKTVPLQKDLIVQRFVFHGDITEGNIVERCGALVGDALTDDIGLTGGQICGHLLGAEAPAGVLSAVKITGVLLGFLLLAEAVVGRALFYQELCVGQIQVPALGLDVGPGGTADVRPLVMVEAALLHGAVNDVRGTLHKTPLIRILNAEDKRAASVAGNEPCVQRCPQIAYVHIAGRGGGKPGADLPVGNAGLHVLKKFHIQSHECDLHVKIRNSTVYIISAFDRKVKRTDCNFEKEMLYCTS